MSPVNALRALELRLPNLLEALHIRDKPVWDLMRYDNVKMEDGRLVDKASKDQVEKAFQAIGFESENPRFDDYVDYYEGSLIKTAFISFPLLNARGYDEEYGQGKAQEKIDLYHKIVKEKFDDGDKTLQRIKQWKPPTAYKYYRHCFNYSRTPERVKPFFKQEEFSVVQYIYSQMDNLKRWFYG
jgi:hypothetical protein